MPERTHATQPAVQESTVKKPLSKRLASLGASVLMGLAGAPFVAGGVTYYDETKPHDVEISQVVNEKMSALTGTEMKIACDDFSTSPVMFIGRLLIPEYKPAGYVNTVSLRFPLFEHVEKIHLDKPVCEGISNTPKIDVTNKPPIGSDQIINYLIVYHEQTHFDGEINEAKTECVATQKLAGRLAGLGYDIEPVKMMVIDLNSKLPEMYQSDDCKIGGAWDMRGENGTSNAWLPDA